MTPSEEALGTGARFIKLLQALAEGDAEFSLKDLSARLSLPTSTVHRLLQLMAASGMVERTGAQGYRTGRELFRVASLIMQKFDVPQTARPLLHELWTEYQETTSLSLYMPATRTSMVVESIRTPHQLLFVIEPYTHLDLVWGSLGRAIMAHIPKEDVEAVIAAATPAPISNRPPPSRTKLLQDLEKTRKRGYALYEDRGYPDVGGVSAPVFDHSGRILGALGVTMPGARFEVIDKQKLVARVVEQAGRLSALLGFKDLPRGFRTA